MCQVQPIVPSEVPVRNLGEPKFLNRQLTMGTQWASVTKHPPVHHPKNPVLGFHGWDEPVPQGSVYLVSSFLKNSWPSFFSQTFCFWELTVFLPVLISV
jgi:hypothetical protein